MIEDKRFWFYVDKGSSRTECWIWTGCVGKGKYDRYGRVNRDGGAKLAHRWSWHLHNGPVPKGMIVCHKCDNPPCVNPDHLFLGTDQDNSDDMRKKGRGRYVASHGEKHGRSKLTNEKALAIRYMYEQVRSLTKVAKEFGVTFQTVSHIKNRKTWTHI